MSVEDKERSDNGVQDQCYVIPDAPWPPPCYARAPPCARCFIDGWKIDLDPFSWPNGKKANGEFTFDKCVFNGPSPALFYLVHYKRDSPHFVTWFHLYCRRDLKIMEPIPMSADPRLLAKYRVDGKGLNKQQFRNYKDAHKLVEKISHLPLDLRVWVSQPQVDNELPFHETIAGRTVLAQQLLRDYQEQGKPILKVLLPAETQQQPAPQHANMQVTEDVKEKNPTKDDKRIPTLSITIPPLHASAATAFVIDTPPPSPTMSLSPLLLPSSSSSSSVRSKSALEQEYGSDVENAEEVKTLHPVAPKSGTRRVATKHASEPPLSSRH